LSQIFRAFEANNWSILTKKSTGSIFRVSPEGVKHTDVLKKWTENLAKKAFPQ
jgi:hypothetical protein